jgi:serine/threonine protein phosphatase 1
VCSSDLEEFLDSTTNHGVMVVHGHSISLRVEELPNRINIDTGAYASNVLTCLVLEGEDHWLLQTA